MTSPWEFNRVGQLSKVGNWIKKFPGPIRYAGPMLLTQLAFIPLLYSYLTFSYLESVGFNVPGLVATVATWVWSKLPFLPQFGLLLKQVASVLLELPVNASNELVWKGVLQTALPLLPVVYFFIILPILDILIGRDRGGQKPAQRTEEDNGYRWVLWAFGLIYMCLLVMCATTAAALPLLSVVTVGVGAAGVYGTKAVERLRRNCLRLAVQPPHGDRGDSCSLEVDLGRLELGRVDAEGIAVTRRTPPS